MAETYCMEGRRLTHSFGRGECQTTVLHDVSLQVRAGEMVLVMGPSGSGKSTLLALLSGLQQPDQGQVLSFGEDLWQLRPAARKAFRQHHFGFIFQGYNLFPALTARQQLEIVLRWGDDVSAADARVRSDAMLDLLGLAEKKSLRPAQLSGGEKQRVAIGRALVKRPTVCFADEPTSALDWKHGRHVVELLRSIASAEGSAVFVVSHDSRLIPFVDQVYRLEDGCLDTDCKAEALAQSSAP